MPVRDKARAGAKADVQLSERTVGARGFLGKVGGPHGDPLGQGSAGRAHPTPQPGTGEPGALVLLWGW